jgi:putative membrane protein
VLLLSSRVHWLSVLPLALLASHVVGNVVWIGAILSVSVILGAAAFMAEPADAGSIARRVYLRLAVPAFLLSFGTGVGRIVIDPASYLHLPWMHAKLAFAFAVIVLHHVIGGRAKRVARGQRAAARGVGILGFFLLLFAACAAVLGVAKNIPI